MHNGMSRFYQTSRIFIHFCHVFPKCAAKGVPFNFWGFKNEGVFAGRCICACSCPQPFARTKPLKPSTHVETRNTKCTLVIGEKSV